MASPQHADQDSLVLELGSLGSAPLSRVGGKALNLGKLAAAGFPVPPGFCLTTSAYALAVPRELDALAARLDGIGPVAASTDAEAAIAERQLERTQPAERQLAQRARELVGTSPVPPEVAAALRTGYAALGAAPGAEHAPAVAVRSSATAEDLSFASFAGQQDSFLDVVGADAVIEAVRRCWASLWTDRAVAYRSANGISHRDTGLAVVVQLFVDAATAGVLFTANPVTGTRGETVIDASPGPGQAVVSGAVNPDHFTVDSATGRILQLVRGRVGAATADLEPGNAGGQPSLADAEVRALTALGLDAQRLFGEPQDVEWVIDAGGMIWLTQSRPITTLYPLPDPSSAEPFGVESEPTSDVRVYLCGSLLQGLTRPITPMGLSALGMWGDRRSPWTYVSPGLRMYMDLTPLVRSKSGRRALVRMLPLADGRSAAVLPALLDDPRFRVIKHPLRKAPATADGARGGGSFASPGLVTWLLPALIRAVLRPEAELRRARTFAQRLAKDLALREPATAFRRLDHAEHAAARTVDGLFRSTLPGPATGYTMLALARWLLRGIAEPRELEAVLRGLPHNVTTEMDLELWRFSVSIAGDPASRSAFLDKQPDELAVSYAAGELPAVAQAGLRGFLERYGHRAVAEIDLGMPRWAEKPDHLLGMISNYLRVEDPEQAPDRQFQRASDHAEARIRSLVERARTRSQLRGRLVALCLHRSRQLCGLRELPKFYVVTVLGEMHRQLTAVGAEMARTGAVAAAADVFFLSFDEVRVGLRGADLKGMVTDRRRIYDAELRRRRIPRLLLSDGTDVEAVVAAAAAAVVAGAAAAPGGMVGTPASTGTATGRVRVILDPVGARLEPGEILVAPSTDPGWTPLFLTAGALVMEMGGVISHGAVVAREYGIPAVVGVPDATSRLRTGQTVTVDGAAGTVTEVATAAADVGTVR
ncbi:Prodigiosin synthesizing transferase PigC [Arthrobacter sp. Bi83]|uniref:PEP/pyruvate-binding domain-containing protein n=1 Tax=Arthrobacter sp. Bi83 TaxID=2822353 RepID=UPI001DDD53C9|nr:PEP/pyruvate-binding domain-containing protein [Arthrobacter sp. Bi83]CAH0239229.1 Prodigiosin synthesizing transferase PigC [Arthrobacter sp. Bi83]